MAKNSSKPQNSSKKILAIATRLFAKFGFDAVTMRQISKESGVSMPSIYHHYGSKEELFKAVEMEMYSAHAQKLLDQIHSKDSAAQRLRRFLAAMFERLDNNPEYLKLLQRNLVDGWAENQAFLVEISLQNVIDDLGQLLNEYSPGKGDGIIPIAIFSMIIGFVTMTPIIPHIKGSAATTLANSQREPLIESILNFIDASTL